MMTRINPESAQRLLQVTEVDPATIALWPRASN